MVKEVTHYGLTREEFASRAGKHSSCFENRLRPLCGNGSFHASMTRRETHVNCEACKLLPPMVGLIAKKNERLKGK